MRSEKIVGPTPNGGAYAVLSYLDNQGDLIEQEEATRFELVEYDEAGEQVFRTYGKVSQAQRDYFRLAREEGAIREE